MAGAPRHSKLASASIEVGRRLSSTPKNLCQHAARVFPGSATEVPVSCSKGVGSPDEFSENMSPNSQFRACFLRVGPAWCSEGVYSLEVFF